MDKVLVLGCGFLGKAFKAKGYKTLGKSEFNVKSKEDAVEKLESLDLSDYDVIINCIAKSNTRWCEDDKNFKEAMFVNGKLPGIISSHCKNLNKKFVHVSTGCMYENETLYNSEEDFLGARCNYTVTKWIGEKGCDSSRDLIIRPRLFFGDFNDKNNFLCKLKNFKFFVSDKTDSFTSVNDCVLAVEDLLIHDQVGVFNVACDGHASVHNVAKHFELYKEEVSMQYIRKRDKLCLVNAKLDISKLEKFHIAPLLEIEMSRCWEKLNEEDISISK